MADGKIVIDTRIRKDQAIKDLTTLKKEAASTAREISSIDKQITGLSADTKLADNLRDAKAAAAETAAELEKVNSQLEAAVSKRTNDLAQTLGFQNFSPKGLQNIARSQVLREQPGLVQTSDTLTAKLDTETSAVAKANAAYDVQAQKLTTLNAQRDALNAKLETQQALVQKGDGAAVRAERASAAIGKLHAALTGAGTGIQKLGQMAGAVFARINNSVSGFIKQLTHGSRRLRYFKGRLKEIVWGAIIFTGLSKAIRSMTAYLGAAIKQTNTTRTALANLKGAAAVAAGPLLSLITPALAAMANAAALALSYISKLVSLLTGKSLSAMKATAKSMNTAAGATNNATAAFDELNIINQDSGSGTGTITPNYDFTGESPFLDSLLASIQQGDWGQVGVLVADKINGAMESIPWEGIQAKTKQIANGIATTLNGAIGELNFGGVGTTLANGLNTVTGFVDTFFQNTNWVTLGSGIGTGMTTAIATIDWPTLGRVLTDKLRAALLLLDGFLETFDFAELGSSIGSMLGAAIGNINWPMFAADFGKLVTGILTTINTALQGLDWSQVAQIIGQMIAVVDWAGLFDQVGQLLSTLMPVILGAALLGGIKVIAGMVKAAALQSMSASITDTLLPAIGKAVPAIFTFLTGTLLPALGTLMTTVVTFLMSSVGGIPVIVIALIVAGIAALIAILVTHWDKIKAWFTSVSEFIKTTIKQLISSAGSTLRQAGGRLISWLSGLGDKLKNTGKSIINGILSSINSVLSGVANGINAVTGMLNGLSFDIPSWVPQYGGKRFGFSVPPVSAFHIPLLAQGAVIPPNSGFLAMLGDQKSGTNIEAPLSTIKQAVAEALTETGNGKDIVLNITTTLDGQVVYQNQQKIKAGKGYPISGNPVFV